MATSNPNESTYTDLSHLVPMDVALTGGASMSAGNTTSRPLPPGAGGAPGSEPVNPPPPGVSNDHIGLNIEPQTSYTKKVGGK
jgi:hypothetical protein